MTYLVTTDALEDLAEVVRYTSDNWRNGCCRYNQYFNT